MQLLEKISTLIASFEKEHPVSSWKYGEMDVWPVLRALVFVECRNHLLSTSNGVEFDWKKGKPNNTHFFKQKVKKWTARLFNLSIPSKKKKNSFSHEPEKSLDFMFFSSWYFRVNYKGQFINKFFQPLLEYISNQHSSSALVVEYSLHPKYTIEYESIRKDTLFLQDYATNAAPVMPSQSWAENHLFRLFFDSVYALGFTEPLDKLLIKKIDRVYRESCIYEELFIRYKPAYAICQTFFNESMFAMVFAAQKAGVVSLDLGHGFPCGTSNLIYTNLENFPDRGYNTLPKLFWVWGDPVKNSMDYWIQKQFKHQVLVGGNPWLEYTRKGLKKERLSSKKVVLYTLSINLPEQFVMDTMKLTAETHEWWIRLHPSIRSSKAELGEVLGRNGVLNYNLNDANSESLPYLLLNCDVHISRNSSSIYESVVFGNYPIILDKEGMAYYHHYVGKEQAYSVINKSSKDLVQLIDFVVGKGKGKEDIEASYKETLDLLVNYQFQWHTIS